MQWVPGVVDLQKKISRLVDHYLKPFVPKIESYIQDSGHLIQLLENKTLPHNCTLDTIDVKAMYTHIPHQEGIVHTEPRLRHATHTTRRPAQSRTYP